MSKPCACLALLVFFAGCGMLTPDEEPRLKDASGAPRLR